MQSDEFLVYSLDSAVSSNHSIAFISGLCHRVVCVLPEPKHSKSGFSH